MSVSTIDGEVREVEMRPIREQSSRYTRLVIVSDDGERHALRKHFAAADIAARLKPGARGRFYLASSLNVGAIHGIRLADGIALQAFPGANIKIFIATVVAGVLLTATQLYDGTQLSPLGLLCIVWGVTGYFLTRSEITAARRQFEADG